MKLTAFCLAMLCCSSALWATNHHYIKPVKDSLDKNTTETPSKPIQPSAPRIWEINNTRIAISFNMNEKTANVKEWIKMKPYFYPTDTLTLDAKSIKIDSLILVDKKGNVPVSYTYDTAQLHIRFAKRYVASDSIMLYLKYTAMPYATATAGSAAITDDRGLYFINTDNKIPYKHPQIWTQGETESNSHWMVTIDKPNTRFTTQIEMTVPDSFVTLSNGVMIKQIKQAGKMRTDIWKMDIPIQAYAVMMATGNFSIVKDHWRNKEVNYYVEPEYAPSAHDMFRHTPEMIEYFSQRTGVPYPWNKYDQVVVRDYVSGAMENTTATLLGEFVNANKREIADGGTGIEDIVSHELFHQWFGDYATCESWSNITVNESFANYGEQLWEAHYYGKNEGDRLAFNDLQIYIQVSSMNDPQLVRFNYDSREDVFDGISYNKGGAILRYLNNLIGDAAFDKAMNLYLTKNALHSTEAHNWRLAVEEATGLDMNWFFNQWYYHGGHPVLKVNNNYSDSAQRLEIDIAEAQSDTTFLFNLPLKAAVIYGKEVTVIDWNVNKWKDTLYFPYKNGQKPVFIPDYYHWLPGEIRDNKKPEQWLTVYGTCNDYINKRLAMNAATKQLSDSVCQKIIDMGLDDTLMNMRVRTLSALKTAQSEKYHRKWRHKIMDLAATDNVNQVKWTALSVLTAWKESDAENLMLKYVWDSSYALAGIALDGIDAFDKDTAYTIALRLLKNDPRSNLDSKIWEIIGKKGNSADIALYEKYVPYKLGSTKYAMAGSIIKYMKTVTDQPTFDRAADVFTTMVIHESMKSIRTSIAGYLFQYATSLKSDTASDDKTVSDPAKRRLDVAKAHLQKIVDAETDKAAIDDLKKMMKDTFDSN